MIIINQIIQFLKKRKLIFFLIICALLFIYSFIEPYWIEIKVTEIRDQDIPAAFAEFRIIFIADIHHGPYFSRNRVRKVVAIINSLNPDLVLLGGDYVHDNASYIYPCFEELSRINAPHGVYAVLGNHDHWESAEISNKAIEKSGIIPLDNKSYWLYREEKRIKIGGVGDLWEDIQNIAATISDVKEDDFTILVSHNPDYAEKLTTNKIDLMLSGHTHGGQITFFGLYAPFLPTYTGQKYRSGIVDTEYTKVIVTNGIGTVTPPLRFFACPQINLIILKQ